jgi:hypothetical protein
MKRLLLAVLVIGGIGYRGIEAAPTEASPEVAASCPMTSSAIDDQVASGMVTPHFIQCDDNQVCATAQACVLMGGTFGGPPCSGANFRCCTLE